MYILIYHITASSNNDDEHTLMFVHAGNMVNVTQLWYTVNGVNDNDGDNRDKKTMFENIQVGTNFRSRLVDEWPTNQPSQVSIDILHSLFHIRILF